ncbi:MAG: alpha-E domain-containing protein [Polyangiaceae bacterium]|nr:alpha-E domain-containing protein [Polyangiaceae bacterium]
MLSRVADALYWMGRYVERAEHAARVLEVTRQLLLDVREVDPAAAELHWQGARVALSMPEATDACAVAFDEHEPGSIASSVARARENARQVREVISSEMWEHLNQTYWALREASQQPAREDELSATLGSVVSAGFSWAGVTDGTMRRGEGWLWIKLGQEVERADRVARLLAVRGSDASGAPARSLGGGDNVLWPTLLRGASALEAYRKVHPARVDPRRVVDFLVLDREFPRSVRHCVAQAAALAGALVVANGDGGGRGRGVERAFGRLASRLEYTDVDDVLSAGLAPFLLEVLHELGGASHQLQRTYFLH